MATPFEQLSQIRLDWQFDPLTPPAIWTEVALVPGGLVNAATPMDGVYMLFGHVNPPFVTDADQTPDTLPVRPVAYLHQSRERLELLHEMIGQYLEATREFLAPPTQG